MEKYYICQICQSPNPGFARLGNVFWVSALATGVEWCQHNREFLLSVAKLGTACYGALSAQGLTQIENQ